MSVRPSLLPAALGALWLGAAGCNAILGLDPREPFPPATAGAGAAGPGGGTGLAGGGDHGGGDQGGGDQGGGGQGGAVACSSPSDCGAATTCRHYACESHECVAENAALGTPCAEDGGEVCDGKGSCAPPSCDDTVKDGDETDTDCGGATCASCKDGDSCKKGTDCASGFCDGAVCTAKKPIGASCNKPGECQSGDCVDARCCDSPCDAPCEACASPKTGLADGICGHVMGGTDPGGACAPGLCDSAGACAVGGLEWSMGFGDWNNQYAYDVWASDAAVDALGNVFVTGYFYNGQLHFGCDPLSAQGYDVFAAKFDDKGTCQWSKRFGDYKQQVAASIAGDASGSVLVAGTFDGTMSFGCQNLTNAGGGSDIFVAKLDKDGACVWSKGFGSGDPQGPGVGGVAVDKAGNVLVAGYFGGTVSFGCQSLTATGNTLDAFVAQLDQKNGACLWSKRFGDAGSQYADGVAADGAGNVFVAGYFDGAGSFEGCQNLTSAGSYDVFVAKLDQNGACLWSKRFGDPSDQQARAVAADPAGNVLVAGNFNGTVNFGLKDLFSNGSDVFVAKFDKDGNHKWSKPFGDGNAQEAGAVAVDGSGNVLLAGRFSGTVNFGGADLKSTGGYDAFVAKLDASGPHLWSRGFGDYKGQEGAGVAADAAGNVVLVGGYYGNPDFGGGKLQSFGAGRDLFVAKLGP
ncbi:MAG: SBBP repeat-containing protein [Deltaproteobacteria bacterium]|nr:SBBP repeat-containing protein [Deltaproteobacteria bacterium]